MLSAVSLCYLALVDLLIASAPEFAVVLCGSAGPKRPVKMKNKKVLTNHNIRNEYNLKVIVETKDLCQSSTFKNFAFALKIIKFGGISFKT